MWNRFATKLVKEKKVWNNFTGLLKRGPVSWHMQVHWRHVGLLWKSVATSWWLTGTAGWDGVWRGVCCVSVRFCCFFLDSDHQDIRGMGRGGVGWIGAVVSLWWRHGTPPNKRTCPGETLAERWEEPATMFGLSAASFMTRAAGAEGGRFPGTDKGPLPLHHNHHPRRHPH